MSLFLFEGGCFSLCCTGQAGSREARSLMACRGMKPCLKRGGPVLSHGEVPLSRYAFSEAA